MKKENYYLQFEKKKIAYCEKVKIAYAKQVAKGEANFVHFKFKNRIVDNRSSELKGKLGEYESIMFDIDESRKWDSTESVEELFNEKFNQIESKKRKEILELLSEYEGLKLFDSFWREQNDIYIKKNQTQPEDKNGAQALSNIKKIKRGFTDRRQALAINYILNYIGVKGIDITEKARFAQFITGNEINNPIIKNTNLYKYLSYPFSGTEKGLVKDLQFIRLYFEIIGVEGITNAINKDISARQ